MAATAGAFRARTACDCVRLSVYGDSDPASDETTREDYASAVIGALRGLNIKQAHVCGLSLGGVIAIAMYAQAPQLCASLIIADSFAFHPDGGAIYERSLAGSRDMRAMAEARVDFLLAQPPDADVRSEVVETMSRIDPASYRIGANAVWLADQRDRASRIAALTLILCGEEDSATPPLLSRELHGMIPNSQIAMISGAGHLANIERPDRFNELVDAFVRGVDASGTS